MKKYIALTVFSMSVIAALPFFTAPTDFAEPLRNFRGNFTVCKNPRIPSKTALQKAVLEKKTAAKKIRISALIDKTKFSTQQLNEVGWNLLSCQNDIVTLTGDKESAPYLAALDGIVAVAKPRVYPFPCACMDSVRKVLFLNPVYGYAPSNLKHSYTGKNILVGIIETEFDTHHPAFLDAQGKTRFIAVWDQQDTTMTNRQGFGYGKIAWAQQLQNDSLFGHDANNPHGTGVTSYAAGSDISRKGTFPYFGVAPDAMIIGVKYTDANVETDVINGLQWIFHVADSLKVPCVVNMSIGISNGPHDGTSLTDRAIDEVSSKRGHIVVGAIGNDGINRTHIAFSLASGESKATWVDGITQSQRSPPRVIAVSGLDQWGDVGKKMADTLYILNKKSMTYKKSDRAVSTAKSASYADTVVWNDSGLTTSDTLLFFSTVEAASGLNQKPHIEITCISTDTDLVMGVSASFLNHAGGVIHLWNAAKKPFESFSIDRFFSGDSASTLNEIGGTAKKIITAGGFISKSQVYLYNGVFVDKGVQDKIGFLSGFSAAGPTIDGRIKPVISAPDEFVVGAMSRGAADYGRTVIWPDTTNTYSRYATGTGTSVAAPIVTGVIALMLQANDTLSSDEVVQIFKSTATKDRFTGPLTTQDNHWGYGKINALSALSELEGITPIKNPIFAVKKAPVSLRLFSRGRQKFISVAYGGSKQTKNHLSLYSSAGRTIAVLTIENETAALPQGLANGVSFVEFYADGALIASQKCTIW